MTSRRRLACPACETALEPCAPNSRFASFQCSACRGTLLHTAALRGASESKHAALEAALRRESYTSPRPCPLCARPFRTFAGQTGESPIQLEACRACRVLWFDGGELATVGVSMPRPSPEVARARAELELAGLREQAELNRLVGALRALAYTRTARLVRALRF